MQKQHDRDVGGGDYLVDRIPGRKADPRVHSIIFFSESYHGIGFFSCVRKIEVKDQNHMSKKHEGRR